MLTKTRVIEQYLWDKKMFKPKLWIHAWTIFNSIDCLITRISQAKTPLNFTLSRTSSLKWILFCSSIIVLGFFFFSTMSIHMFTYWTILSLPRVDIRHGWTFTREMINKCIHRKDSRQCNVHKDNHEKKQKIVNEENTRSLVRKLAKEENMMKIMGDESEMAWNCWYRS